MNEFTLSRSSLLPSPPKRFDFCLPSWPADSKTASVLCHAWPRLAPHDKPRVFRHISTACPPSPRHSAHRSATAVDKPTGAWGLDLSAPASAVSPIREPGSKMSLAVQPSLSQPSPGLASRLSRQDSRSQLDTAAALQMAERVLSRHAELRSSLVHAPESAPYWPNGRSQSAFMPGLVDALVRDAAAQRASQGFDALDVQPPPRKRSTGGFESPFQRASSRPASRCAALCSEFLRGPVMLQAEGEVSSRGLSAGHISLDPHLQPGTATASCSQLGQHLAAGTWQLESRTEPAVVTRGSTPAELPADPTAQDSCWSPQPHMGLGWAVAVAVITRHC